MLFVIPGAPHPEAARMHPHFVAKSRNNPLFKLVIVMKFVALLLTAAALQAAVVTEAQGITYSARNLSMEKVISDLREQTGFYFFYSREEIDQANPVTVRLRSVTLTEALQRVLKDQPLKFSIRGNTVFIIKKEGSQPGAEPREAAPENPPPVRVEGTVRSSSGEPLAGVSVAVQGMNLGTMTDGQGRFSLELPAADRVLVFSYVGFETLQLRLDGKTRLNIVLQATEDDLGEVVVVGYGTQKKVSLTSAVSEIKGDELARRPSTSIEQTLQGQLPGLTVQDLGGAPGNANTTVRVRGITTLNNNDPLIIVDGVEQPFSYINPQDIESVSVLKDASSTSIYGSRAANGVILITTKRGKAGKATVQYSGFYAVQKAILQPEQMEFEDYLRLQNMNFINAGSPPPYSEEMIQTMVNGSPYEYPRPFAWYEAMLSPAPQVNNTLSVSGGSEQFKGRLSLRFQDQDGIIANTNSKLSEIRVSTDFKVSEKINISADANYRRNNAVHPQGLTPIFRYMMSNSIWTVPKYPDGTYGAGPQGNNPLLLAEIGGTDRKITDYSLGSLRGEWKILKGLSFSTQFAAGRTAFHRKEFTASFEVRDRNNPAIIRESRPINTLNEYRNNSIEFTFNNLLNYTHEWADHSLNALVGYSTIQHSSSRLSAFRQGFYNNDVQAIGQGTNDATQTNDGFDQEWGLRSYFSRLNYAFRNKYLFEANARYDGSSRFTEKNRYSFFPSFSAGWRISEEKFWTIDFVNELKLRGSWGKTGNQAVELYSYFPALSQVTYTFSGAPVQGFIQQKLASEDLTWETTTQVDIGLDAQFLNNRITLGVDHYYKRTDGILFLLPVPETLGLEATPQNAGVVDNMGWEFMAGFRNRFGDFGLDLGFNFSINKNEVVDLAGTGPYLTGSDVDPRFLTGEGYPINSFWGYLTDGYYQTQEQADNAPYYMRPGRPGDVNYIDLNKDGIISPADMTYLGNSFPKYIYGSTMQFTYKNFGLHMHFQGAAGFGMQITRNMIQSGTSEGFTYKLYTNNVWTPENPNARFPLSIKRDTRNQVNSDRNVIDADYIRLKNIQLSYNFPQHISRKLYMDRLTVYVSATNLFTISNLNEWGLDPEAISGYQNYYPQVGLYTAGVHVQF